MIHLIKLAVGVDDLDHLRAVQAHRAVAGAVALTTRRAPTRTESLLAGGSLYWVIRGVIRGRQRVLAVEAGVDGEGRACCVLRLAAEAVPVRGTAHRPFQGWRYLDPAVAPPDLAEGESDLPEHLATELRALGLL